MTISSTTRTAGPFTGNGVAYLFPFGFKVFTAADLYVASGAIATGVQTTLALGTDYTVALNANQNSNPGGTVVLTAGPLANGFRLTITSDLANLQPTELINQGGFYPEVLTASLDRATIQVQQLQGDLDLSLQFPLTDPSVSNILPSAEVRAGQVLGFDSTGTPIAVILPTFTIGIVTTGPVASVINVGTATSPILNFVFPNGTGASVAMVFTDATSGAPFTVAVANGSLTVTAGNGTGAPPFAQVVLFDTVGGAPYTLSVVDGALTANPGGSGGSSGFNFTDVVTGTTYVMTIVSGAITLS